jgi:hypothetical protein
MGVFPLNDFEGSAIVITDAPALIATSELFYDGTAPGGNRIAAYEGIGR